MVATFELPYFPRGRLIDDVAKVYASGLKQGMTLFAPRRYGKTMFVRHELLPYARETLGWRTIYVDLWARRDVPGLALTEGLEAYALEHRPRWKRMHIKELRAQAGTTGASIESTFEMAAGAPSGALEARLPAAIKAAVGKDATLLVIDEVQALGGIRNANFAAALRTALQAQQDRLRVFYTGSSRDGLNRLFRLQHAPLFESAISLALPGLKDDFVDDRLAFLKARSRAKVQRAELIEAFDDLGRTPEYLNDVVLYLLIANDGNVAAAVEKWRAERETSLDAGALKGLRALDLAVLSLLATPDHPSPYSDGALAVIGGRLGVGAVTTGRVQGAIRKLIKRGLVAPTGEVGGYEVEDRALLLYLRAG